MATEEDFPKEDIGQYSVESFQIPVPGGDCSIHLRIKGPAESTPGFLKNTATFAESKENSNATTRQRFCMTIREWKPASHRGTIEKAVLVDGGHDGQPGSFGTKAAGRKKTNSKNKDVVDFALVYLAGKDIKRGRRYNALHRPWTHTKAVKVKALKWLCGICKVRDGFRGDGGLAGRDFFTDDKIPGDDVAALLNGIHGLQGPDANQVP